MGSLTTEGNENEEKDFNDEGALSHRDLILWTVTHSLFVWRYLWKSYLKKFSGKSKRPPPRSEPMRIYTYLSRDTEDRHSPIRGVSEKAVGHYRESDSAVWNRQGASFPVHASQEAPIFSTLTCRAIKLTFEIENISSTDQIVSVYDFKCYSDDVASSAYYYGDNGLSTTTLSSGRKATGNVYFEVPQNANSIDVEYETNYWSGNKAIFVVK